MVKLNRIYTRTGDTGRTRLVTGEQVSKADCRVEAYGSVNEANACIGLVRIYLGHEPRLDEVLERVQNELFDLGADLATPGNDAGALRVTAGQVDRLEREIDELNTELQPLKSFVLPGGSPAAAALHLACTVCRRAERDTVRLSETEIIGAAALKYLNRLSDLLFVAARFANRRGEGDVLWRPGATR